MPQIIWTNFAVSELKNIFLYYRMVANEKTANRIKKSVLNAVKPLVKQPHLGAIEENLSELKQNHRYIIESNYKIIYRILDEKIYITDVFDCRQDPEKMKKINLPR